MDISDEELFEATPSCSTSTDRSLNLTDATIDSTQYAIQEKDGSSSLAKNISLKLIRLPNTGVKKGNRSRRKRWKYGIIKKRVNREKRIVPPKFVVSQPAFQNMESIAEAVSSKDANGANGQMDTHLYNNQSHEVGKSCEDVQQNEQAVQSGIKNFISSTYLAQEEDLCINETHTCARTLPYTFYQKDTPSDLNIMGCSDSSSVQSSNSNTTESSLHSDKFHLSDHLSPSNKKAMKRLLHSRLKLASSKMGKWIDERKFKRKHVLSDSDTEEQYITKKRRRVMPLSESDDEDASVNNTEVIEDNNQSKSHFFLEKINEKETNIQISSTAQVILTRLEEMETEDVIKWRESHKTNTILDTIVSESVERQLDRRKPLQNLVALESQETLILSEGDEILKIKDISDDILLTTPNSCVENHTIKSKANKLRKRYKLFKKPRVLLIKLDTLQCSFEDGRYSATNVDYLTKKYVNFVINSNSENKSHESKMYKQVASILRQSMNTDTICIENHNTSPSLFRRSNVNESSEPLFTEKSSIQDTEITENNDDENAPFRRRPIQNHLKTSLTSEKKNGPLTPSRIQVWRNAFRGLLDKPQKITISTQSTSTTETLPVARNLMNELLLNTECKNALASASTSSTKPNTPTESPSTLTSSRKQTKASAKLTKCNNTSKPESSTSNKNLPNDANVEEIISRKDFTQSKDDTVSKSLGKNVKEKDITTSDASINSNKQILKMSNSHNKVTNRELSTNDSSVRSKKDGVDQLAPKKDQLYRCNSCDKSFKKYKVFLKHIADDLYQTCAIVKLSSMNASLENSKHSQNLENSQPSTSQHQCSSINEEDESTVDSEDSSASSSPLSLKKRLRNSNNKRNSTNIILQRDARTTCKICLRVCNNDTQMLEHMLKHMATDLKKMYTSIENKISSSDKRKSNNNNVEVFDGENVSSTTVGDEENSVELSIEEAEVENNLNGQEERLRRENTRNDINEQEKRLPGNTNKSSTKSLVASKVSQQDATKTRNKTSNLSTTECTTEQDIEKQSTSVASNVEREATKTQSAEKEEMIVIESSLELQSTKSLTICKCHKPKNGTNDESMGSNIQIEVVLLCVTCKTVFRRFECFDAHFTQLSAKSTLCNKTRRHGRTAKLLCVNCQQVLNSMQDLFNHLVMHSRINRTGTATFCCNICKVIFYCFGPLLNTHFQNHAKNPFFLASRLSFPRLSYIGSKLIRLPVTDDDSVEVYMQVADYVCHECRMPFVSGQGLKSHKATCPSVTNTIDIRSGSSDGRSAISNTPNKVPILLICGFCNKTFYSRMSFELHSLEHTQKREMHLHYTCVPVTAVTKVYICKVCTTMWRSLETFDEHWQTHGELRETYICSRCRSNHDSIDQFQKHALVHKTIDLHQIPITCEVIYYDINDQNSTTNLQKDATVNDLPYMNLSCFGRKDLTGKTVNNKSRDLQESTQALLERLLFGNRSPQVKAMSSGPSLRTNKETQATRNVSQVPVQVPSFNSAVAQSKRSSNDNSRNINNESDEEEDLAIVLSESEESSVSNGIKNNIDSTPSTKHQNTQENTKSTTSVTNGQMQCSNDAVQAVASAKTSSNVSGSASTNSRISVITPRKSMNTKQLNTNTSVLKDNKTLENSEDHSVSEANSSREELNSLPKNVMSSVPKSFLRVKSLAELTNTPLPQKQLCQGCGLFFESEQKLKTHLCLKLNVQLSCQTKKDGQASSTNNVCLTKSTFSPLPMPTTSTQDPLPSAITTHNLRPNTSNRVIGKSRQYQVIGVKPLHSDKSMNTDVSKPKETPPQEMTCTSSLKNVSSPQHISQKTAYHQNLPPHIGQPLNKSVQPIQQQQSTGTAAVRPFLQITYQTPRPPPPPYLQHQQPPQQQLQQPQLEQQSQQQLQLQRQLQQQRVQQRLQQVQQRLQQQQVQQRLQQQQVQQRLQQQQVQQQLQQQQPQLQLQQQQSQLQLQQQQSQLQLQQQQLPQQLQPQSMQPQLQSQQPQLQSQQPQLQSQQPQLQSQQPQLQSQQPQLQSQQPQLQSQQPQLQSQQPQLQSQQPPLQSQQPQQLQQQLQLQLQEQQLQQQQLQQQQQMAIGNNVMHYVISKTDMSYQLQSTNLMSTNSDNVMLVAVNTMQQISKNPERYVCLYCPGFECGSVQEFALHEHSPKHEARSHYNGVAFINRT